MATQDALGGTGLPPIGEERGWFAKGLMRMAGRDPLGEQYGPRLMALNPGMDLGLAPKVVPGEIGDADLEALGGYVAKIAAAGVPLTDKQTTTILRKKAGLPEEPDDVGADRDLGGQAPQMPPTEKRGRISLR